MRVQVIQEFWIKEKRYTSGDFIDVSTETAKYLIQNNLVKYQLGPVSHKMIMSPKEAKS
jgi:hypothetical protein